MAFPDLLHYLVSIVDKRSRRWRARAWLLPVKELIEMTDVSSGSPAPGRDVFCPCGEAALFLVESLMFGLVARSGLSIEEAVGLVEDAAEAHTGTSDDRGDPEDARPGVRHLKAIARSLMTDLPKEQRDGLDGLDDLDGELSN